MTPETLEPNVDLMTQEYVLVQAWKKTASYIRYHNWFSDTLELDRIAVNLPRFLAELAEQLREVDGWTNDPLRIVPAPKSQAWRVRETPDGKRWEPVKTGTTGANLRPLAHLRLKDQVAATAVMLCLADRVETLQGDPRGKLADARVRGRVVSYGNRLFCDEIDGELRHRWGSKKLYRSFYQDYQSFLARPEIAAELISTPDDTRVVIVHSDLRQFYDRVSPELLAKKIATLSLPGDDPNFFRLAERLMNWQWDKKDSGEVLGYAQQAELSDFSRIALPQGLVAAGFFSNVVLLDFDRAILQSLYQDIRPGVRLEDASRYVDDLRIVLTVARSKSLSEIEELMLDWLKGLLDVNAAGLLPSKEKTKAATFRDDERPFVRQSRKMALIQRAVSGGFDAIAGEEILNAVQGLIRSQARYSRGRTEGQGWSFSPIVDVADATVARFAAGRFRSTYRSLRPLLPDPGDPPENGGEEATEGTLAYRSRAVRTQAELDDEARAFALGLIEIWVEDPSNVRLLRIGLDLWPADDLLKNILDLLRPFTETGGKRKAPRRVAWYCLSEILRAGATETGFVEDGESLPDEIDINRYRERLRDEAVRLASLPPRKLPWYLRQQVFLFLAATAATQAPIVRAGRSPETKHYRELIRFLRGEGDGLTGADFATLAILSRRSFRDRGTAVDLANHGLTVRRLEEIAERDPSFALEILESRPGLSQEVSPRVRDDLCLKLSSLGSGELSLAEVGLQPAPDGPLRNEMGLLRFASQLLLQLPSLSEALAIAPSDVRLRLHNTSAGFSEGFTVRVVSSRVSPLGSMYHSPAWCPAEERWRFQLGYLMRFILSARPDFTTLVRPPSWRETVPIYRSVVSHWYQRLYGLFNGHSAFGDDWLPISDWTGRLLFRLLRWPGCQTAQDPEEEANLEVTRSAIEEQLGMLAKVEGSVTLLQVRVPLPEWSSPPRPLRACVVQTVIPTPLDFAKTDLTFSGANIRKRHRNHLSAALAAIRRMLDLRETHKGRDGRLDWLILPELSVHPDDVRTHIVPFVRTHKAIVLAGLTYQELFEGKPLINSALWVIPTWSRSNGLQVLIRRQGKLYLNAEEEKFNEGTMRLQGFRPCQWLVGYEWSSEVKDEPLWLTASICYDATDLGLAADLRNRSDVFAIPALNKDVGTFDHMALALHYHMFQMVIVANNGIYGGSNAYAPYTEPYLRQVFHLHGQPQASIAFLEIDDIAAFKAKRPAPPSAAAGGTKVPYWKSPPAGIQVSTDGDATTSFDLEAAIESYLANVSTGKSAPKVDPSDVGK